MGNKTTVSCGTYLDIRHAEGLKERLLAALAKDASQCTLIANKVERVDSAGLQLIYAFKQQAQVKNIRVIWQKPSDELIKACQLLGMSQVLDL